MTAYTDDDAQAATAVVKLALEYRYSDATDIAESVLKTVAPAIAARAKGDLVARVEAVLERAGTVMGAPVIDVATVRRALAGGSDD